LIPSYDLVARADPAARPPGRELGRSREGRPVEAWRFGRGDLPVSLIAGCHADEPIGPAYLRRLVACLSSLPDDNPAIAGADWWIVPHVNPDGEARNRAWAEPLGARVDPVAYLRGAIREAPGDDVEFGFPRDAGDDGARPENRALAGWWREAGRPFALHASLHSMSVAEGPWFLVEGAWRDRIGPLAARCRRAVASLGYRLHDVDRGGDKGFERIGPGFSTRPDSRPMIRYFRDRDDERTAALFRPTSMETIRALGGDPLTLVSEMPLFLLPPRPGDAPSTSDDLAVWKERLTGWRADLVGGKDGEAVRADVAAAGIRPMPVADQMRLVHELVAAGLELVRDD
jgi:hypothetical protein